MDKNENTFEGISKVSAVEKIESSNKSNKRKPSNKENKSSRRSSKVIVSYVENSNILQKTTNIENKTRKKAK